MGSGRYPPRTAGRYPAPYMGLRTGEVHERGYPGSQRPARWSRSGPRRSTEPGEGRPRVLIALSESEPIRIGTRSRRSIERPGSDSTRSVGERAFTASSVDAPNRASSTVRRNESVRESRLRSPSRSPRARRRVRPRGRRGSRWPAASRRRSGPSGPCCSSGRPGRRSTWCCSSRTSR